MDQGDYHQQLHTLKDRVNALNLQYSPRREPAPLTLWGHNSRRALASLTPSTPQLSSGDDFTAQLRDVKAHLDRMQASLSAYQARADKCHSAQLRTGTSGDMNAQNRLTLPSGPLFWQLFNSLRSDFHVLDTRVAGLEQDVDALEDRVDKLEPDRFTPPASTTSHEDSEGVPIIQQPASDLICSSNACLPELCSTEQSAGNAGDVLHGQHHDMTSSLASQQNGPFEWQCPSAGQCNWDSLPQVYASGQTNEFNAAANGDTAMQGKAAVQVPGDSSGNHALQDYQMQLVLLEQQNKKRLLQARQEQASMGLPFAQQPPSGMSQPGMDPSKMMAAMWEQTMPHLQAVQSPSSPTLGSRSYVPLDACDVANTQSSIYPEGVTFRDREIDRMDDQLRAVQESLKSSEALAAAQDNTMGDMRTHIQAMQAENQQLAAENTDRSATIKKLRSAQQSYQKELEMRTEERDRHAQTIDDRERACRYWQERCEQQVLMYQRSIADRDRALHRWEESYNAASVAWRQEHERANATSARLDQYRAERKETEQLIRNYEHERDQLKEFCEHKDTVIAKQERVMSRGAQMMEERDAEIDRLQRRLRIAEDDTQNEQRQQKRLARLLDETQAELAHLRNASEMQAPGTAEERPHTAQHQAEHILTASTEAVDGRDAFEIPGSFPREAKRSAGRHRSDEDDSDIGSSQAAMTGSPRQRRPRRHESLRHLSQRASGRQPRRERSPPPRSHRLPERPRRRQRDDRDKNEGRPDLPERPRARFSGAVDAPPAPPLRFSNAIDPPIAPPLRFNAADAPVAPPPGFVPARKMVSEADLRNYSNHRASRDLSRHQSMQDLPGARQRLQPYVETEGESEAENDVQQGPAA